jgi:hypothetical protein
MLNRPVLDVARRAATHDQFFRVPDLSGRPRCILKKLMVLQPDFLGSFVE